MTTSSEPAVLPASPGGQQPSSLLREPLRTATVAVVLVITLIAFEAMAVSAALPTAARDLHGLRSYGWAFTGFLLATVVGQVMSGQLCDARGPRPALTAGLSAFLAGLLVAGSSTTMLQLIAGRVVQGLGAGLLITAVYVLIGETYPQALQPKVFAATSSAWVVPSLLGPIVSGSLTQHASWRWVFLGLVPFVLLGACLLLVSLRRLPLQHRPAGGEVAGLFTDPRRVVRALAVAAGVGALAEVAAHPKLVLLPVGLAGVAVLIWGLRGLLPAGTIVVRPGVAAPVALRGLMSGAFFGIESGVPLAMSVQHGYGATAAGLPLACAGITWAIGSWWQGRSHGRDDLRRRVRLVRTGFGCVALAGLAVALAEQTATAGWLIYPAWALAGLGAGLTMSSTSVLLLRATTDAERGADSAALQLSDSTSSAITTGAAGALVAAAAAGHLGYGSAFAVLGTAMAALALLGAVMASRAGHPGGVSGLGGAGTRGTP